MTASTSCPRCHADTVTRNDGVRLCTTCGYYETYQRSRLKRPPKGAKKRARRLVQQL